MFFSSYPTNVGKKTMTSSGDFQKKKSQDRHTVCNVCKGTFDLPPQDGDCHNPKRFPKHTLHPFHPFPLWHLCFWGVIYTWICLDWCFFTDCTMVNHQETTIWDNSFGTFSKHFMQINPSIFDPWPKWKVEFSTKNSPNLVRGQGGNPRASNR